MAKAETSTPPADAPAKAEPKATLRVRLIDDSKVFGVPVRDAKGNFVEEVLFNRDHMEHDIPAEAEERVRANMACPFPDVYDVDAEIPPEIQLKLAKRAVTLAPPGKVARRGAQ